VIVFPQNDLQDLREEKAHTHVMLLFIILGKTRSSISKP